MPLVDPAMADTVRAFPSELWSERKARGSVSVNEMLPTLSVCELASEGGEEGRLSSCFELGLVRNNVTVSTCTCSVVY